MINLLPFKGLKVDDFLGAEEWQKDPEIGKFALFLKRGLFNDLGHVWSEVISLCFRTVLSIFHVNFKSVYHICPKGFGIDS